MRARSASGSVDSPSAVEPTTSQKRTVTTLRCSRGGSAAASAAPHALQKRASSGFSRPHWARRHRGSLQRSRLRSRMRLVLNARTESALAIPDLRLGRAGAPRPRRRPRSLAASCGSKRPAPTPAHRGGAGGDRQADRLLGASARRPPPPGTARAGRRPSRRARRARDAARTRGCDASCDRAGAARSSRFSSVITTLRGPISAIASSAIRKSSSSSSSCPDELLGLGSGSARRGTGPASTPACIASPSLSSTTRTSRRARSRITSA